jgi:phospholipid/cholesterol/gamma-HCH transport system substrate-binding protein
MLTPPRVKRSIRRLPRFQTRVSRRVLGVIAIFVLFAIVVLAATRPNPFRQVQTVWVRFNNAQGLGSIDRNVRVAGVDVGTIGTVLRVGDDAVMALEIDPGIPVHSDAIAALRPHTLFEGSDFVELEPGSPSAPLLDGKVIPKSQTRVYVSLDQATRVLNSKNRGTLRELVHGGARVLQGRAVPAINKTLRAAPRLTKELGPTARALQGPHGNELAGAIQGLSRTAGAVASRQQDLQPLIEHANATTAALDVDGGAPLDASLRALPGALQELVAGGGRLTNLIDRLDAVAVSLRPAVLELAPVLREGRPILRSATPVTRDAVPLVARLRLVLSRVAAVSPELTSVIDTVQPGVRILANSVVPYLNSRSKLGMPVYLQLVSAFAGATGSERPFENRIQNPAGAGHLLRLGAYFDPKSSLGNGVLPSCAVIALLSPSVANDLQAAGLCNP